MCLLTYVCVPAQYGFTCSYTVIQNILPCTVLLMQLKTQALLSAGLYISYQVVFV